MTTQNKTTSAPREAGEFRDEVAQILRSNRDLLAENARLREVNAELMAQLSGILEANPELAEVAEAACAVVRKAEGRAQ